MKDSGKDAREANTQPACEAKPKRVGKTYRNPYDQFDKWCGLGPRPMWLKKWLDNGGTLEELRIEAEPDSGENNHGPES